MYGDEKLLDEKAERGYDRKEERQKLSAKAKKLLDTPSMRG